MIDGKRRGSIDSGYSTWMNRSSAGARSNAPPHAKHALVSLTTRFISSISKLTGHRTSTRSAVPAGEVIALDDVLGMVKPAAATIGTTRSVVLSPGTPPILCLSKMGPLSHRIVFPVETIALERASASSMLMPQMFKAVTKAASSMSLRCLSTTSLIICFISEARSRCPIILSRMYPSDSGLSAGRT